MATGDKLRGEAYVVHFDESVDHVTPDYAIIGGLRSNGMNLTMEAIDVSDKGSAGWSDVLAGMRSMEVSGSGIMVEGDTVQIAVRAAALARTKEWFKMINEFGDEFEGQFFITAWNESGEHNGEHAYDFTLMNSGAVTLTPGT
jgi:predicted secreted protein